MIRFAVAFGLCFVSGFGVAAQDAGEIAFVKAFFEQLQPKSIKANREFCGYFGLDANDNYVATRPKRGQRDGCFPPEPPAHLSIFASYHTHGAFHLDFDTEVPSEMDIRADTEEEVDGYISTPGGRIWFIDTLANPVRAQLVCGAQCVTYDKNYRDTDLPKIRKTYTLKQIIQRDQ
jgi:hypothetical protein